jgi:excisionase family DNA binding protein
MLKLKAPAEYLGVSTWTLRRILRSGEIPYVQRGEGNILLDLRDLDADIEKNKRLG